MKQRNYKGCGIPATVAVSLIIWVFILISLSSCSQEKCEDELSNQFPYEVIYTQNGIEYREFFDTYITLYKDTFTTFSTDYCSNGRLKTKVFRLENGTFKINQL